MAIHHMGVMHPRVSVCGGRNFYQFLVFGS